MNNFFEINKNITINLNDISYIQFIESNYPYIKISLKTGVTFELKSDDINTNIYHFYKEINKRLKSIE